MQGFPRDAPLALVLVQHLSRDKQSLLPEILARRTALSVVEARDEMKIEMGHAYVIPAATQMTVIDGHLRVRPRPAGPSGSGKCAVSISCRPIRRKSIDQVVLPDLLRERGDSTLRIWVPGCASGEEVYSLAIALFEALAEEAELVPLQIFGTDVSKKSVEQARAGVYAEAIAAEVSPERLRRFFSKLNGQYQICKAIRERCVFARQDLTRDPPFSRLDLVMCRNTLIHLGQPIQRRVIAMIHYSLKPNGLLMLGRAETPVTSGDLFSTVDKRTKIYQKKLGASPPEFDFRSAPFDVRDPSPVREAQSSASRR